ncbi:helix-turn-helix domain-containing protein [Pararhodobacter oceanensis]|uniref:helix-turn-helix domain-containing protein n=1 Tax=Pararhodobacter oceanensis TaxID=2172121 RepID=UPI003A94FB41
MIWRKELPPAQTDDGQRGFDDFELQLGDVLRGERATLGKSLLDVQRELHIRAAHIAAIENGELEAFETQSFVAGFVRSYARYLGMDPEWVYERFCIEHNFQVAHGMSNGAIGASRTAKQIPVHDPRGAPLKGVGLLPDPTPFWHRVEPGALGSVTVLIALILGLGFAGYTVLKEVQRVQVAPADMVPNVVSDFDPLAPGAGIGSRATAFDSDPLTSAQGTGPALSGQRSADATTVSSTSPSAGSAEGMVRIARPQALDVPVLTPRDGPIAAIVPVTPTPSPRAITTDDAVAQALADALDDAAAPQVLAAGPDTVELLAVRPSWLRVRAADGSVVFERILDAGERYTIPQTEEPPTLHAGNSGSVYFLINGEAYGPAAPGAQVVRNIPLDVAALREGFAVADLDRDDDLAVHVARLRDE